MPCKKALDCLASDAASRTSPLAFLQMASSAATSIAIQSYAARSAQPVLRGQPGSAARECEKLRASSAPGKFYGQAERAISTGKLRALLRFHFQPIKQVVFLCPSCPLRVGRSHLGECFTLICIQRLSQPNFATQPCHWHDSWNTRGSSIPVLSY
jgi:hypothetical protein